MLQDPPKLTCLVSFGDAHRRPTDAQADRDGIVIAIGSVVIAAVYRDHPARVAFVNLGIMMIALAVVLVRGFVNLRHL